MAVQSSDLRQIKGKLVLWDVRLRATQSLIWLPRGVVGGLVLALIVALASRFRPILDRGGLIVLSIALAILGAAIAVVAVWLWRRSAMANARRFDRLFGLRERLSTALELSQGVLPVESKVIARRQLEQAAQAAGHVKPGRYMPLRLDWRWWAGVAIAALAVVLTLVIPNPQDEVLAQQAAVKAAVTETLTRLEQLKTQAQLDPGLTAEEKAATIKSLDEAIQTLKQPDISQQEALAALNNAQQELKDLSSQSAAKQEQALEGMSGLFSETAAKDLANALASGDMQAAGEALKNIDPSKLTPEQQQALAQALQDAAGALQDIDPNLAQQLGQAASALQSGDTAGAQKALGQAGESMQQQGASGSSPQVDQYSDQVGQNGQSMAGAGGKNPGSQPGQSGMGQAQARGQGANQNQQGQGPGSGGAGRGEGTGEAPGGVTNGQMPTDNGPGDGGERNWDDVFSPQRIGGEGGDKVDIPGKPDAGVPTGVEGNFANNPSGQANVPYNQVWSNYADSVNKALDSGYIPLGMRDLIKNYFSNLDPNKK